MQADPSGKVHAQLDNSRPQNTQVAVADADRHAQEAGAVPRALPKSIGLRQLPRLLRQDHLGRCGPHCAGLRRKREEVWEGQNAENTVVLCQAESLHRLLPGHELHSQFRHDHGVQ